LKSGKRSSVESPRSEETDEELPSSRSEAEAAEREQLAELAKNPELFREQFAFFPNPQFLMKTKGHFYNIIEERSADDSDEKEVSEGSTGLQERQDRPEAILKKAVCFKELRPDDSPERCHMCQTPVEVLLQGSICEYEHRKEVLHILCCLLSLANFKC